MWSLQCAEHLHCYTCIKSYWCMTSTVVARRRHKALVSSEGVFPSDWQPWPLSSVSLMHSVITHPHKIFSRWCAGVGID